MEEPVVTAITGADQKPVVQADNMTDAEFTAKRLQGSKAAEKPPEAEKKPEDAPKEPENEAGPKDADKGPSREEVLSKAKSGNLDDLSEEELGVLAKAIGSKAVARFGELTAKRKAAEEETARLRAQLASQEQEKQNAAPPPIKDNPYASITDTKALAEKAREIKENIDALEAALDDASDLRGEDVAATVGDKEYTKKQIKDSLRAARKARDDYLPDIARRIAVAEQGKQTRANLIVALRRELPWVDNKEDDRTKRLNAIMADPRLKKLEEVAPEIAAQMPYWFGHATNSLYTRREIPLDEKTLTKAREEPPENPTASAGAARATGEPKMRAVKELEDRFSETGSKDDWVRLRTAKIGQRKTIR